MNNFSDFDIKPNPSKIVGDKIKIKKIIGQPVIIHHYKIVPSDFPDKGNGMRLDAQIEVDGTKHLLRTSSTQLQEMITQIPVTGFPIKTIIQPDGESFKFT